MQLVHYVFVLELRVKDLTKFYYLNCMVNQAIAAGKDCKFMQANNLSRINNSLNQSKPGQCISSCTNLLIFILLQLYVIY